jgi:PAS domain S-box-containing protein
MPAPVIPAPHQHDHQFELLVDALVDYAVYMLDLDGFIVSWNRGAERIKGYSRAEVVDQHFSQFFTREEQLAQLPRTMLERARTTGFYEGEGWRLRKGGARFWANSIVRPITDENGKHIGYAKITRDMTEKRAAEQAATDSEQRFRMLVDGVFDYAIYMLDPSGVIINWNRGAERLKGYSADEILGQHFSKFYTKEDRAKGLPGRVLAEATANGRYEGEGWRVRKDGGRFWASIVVDTIRNEAGQIEGFAKITRDITERRAAQAALRESERQFRLLVNNVTDYALYLIDPNGIITSWNTGAQRIKGYTADEIIGQHFSRFYTEADRSAGAPARALYTALHEGRFEAEAWRVRKNGELFWANVVIDPVRDENGNLVGFAKITRDITERRQAQLAREEAAVQRAHSQKMDAIGQLTGGVAHDFNNLLTIVAGQVMRLRKAFGKEPLAAQALDAIDLASQRGATLTRQLLTFSRRQAFRPTVVQPAERITAIKALLTTSIGSGIDIRLQFPEGIWPIKVDTNEFELAVVNLVLNARDAMPRGGTLTVSIENIGLLPEDTPAGLIGDFVAIRVSDTGEGIAPDVVPKVFEPFFTTKQADKGTGLGLSQVHGFAHQSQGTVAIESELGQGTTVTIYLPRSTEAATEIAAPVQEAAPGEGKILLVEDNPEVADVTEHMCRDLGYQVSSVRNAAQALLAVDREPFDLVISDVVMPGDMDGIKLARTLRERQPGIPVLLVTGYSQRAGDAVAEFPILRKPYQLSELSRHVSGLLAAARASGANVVKLRGRQQRTE